MIKELLTTCSMRVDIKIGHDHISDVAVNRLMVDLGSIRQNIRLTDDELTWGINNVRSFLNTLETYRSNLNAEKKENG